MLLHEFLTENIEIILVSVRQTFLEGRDRAQIAEQDASRREPLLRRRTRRGRVGAAQPRPDNQPRTTTAPRHGAVRLAHGDRGTGAGAPDRARLVAVLVVAPAEAAGAAVVAHRRTR